MAQVKPFVRPLVSAVIIGASIAGLYNVMSDDAELRRHAGRIACGDDAVRSPSQGARYPIFQKYTFQCGSQTVPTTCTRTAYLLGPYTCRKD